MYFFSFFDEQSKGIGGQNSFNNIDLDSELPTYFSVNFFSGIYRSQRSKSTFQDSWFINRKYNLGISIVETNKTKAYCKLCHKTFDLTYQICKALNSQQKRQKH